MSTIPYRVKIKMGVGNTQIEKEDYTYDKKYIYEKISDLFCEQIKNVIQRNPHVGYSHHNKIETLEFIAWTSYNTKGKIIKSGRYNELKDGDAPVCFMTDLHKSVDDILYVYHKRRIQENAENKDTMD